MREKRQHRRIPFIQKITLLTKGGKTCISESRDLSIGGIFLVTDSPLELGASGLCILTCKKDGKKCVISIEFTIVRSIPSSPGKTGGMGLQFEKIDAENDKLIRDLMESISPDDTTEE